MIYTFFRINLYIFIYIEYFFFVAFCTLYFLSSIHFCTNFSMQLSIYYYQQQLVFKSSNEPFGGLKWTRTIDLTLIRRVL